MNWRSLKFFFSFLRSDYLKKRFCTTVFIAILISNSYAVPAYSIENGSDDLGNERLVPIYKGQYSETSVLTCSGFLYAPDIVFSAGHCFNTPGSGSSDFFVGEPGRATAQLNKKIKVVDRFVPSDMDDVNYNNDFAILILESRLTQIEPARIISVDKLNQAIKINSDVKISGYGFYSNACFQYAPNCVGVSGLESKRARLDMPRVPKKLIARLSPEEQLKNKVNIFRSNGYEVNAQFFEGTSVCSGDSGGPNTVVLDGVEFYIGPTSRGSSANACGMGGGESPGGGYMTFYPASAYPELIEQSISAAKTWRDVAKNSPKTILCIKSGKEKIVTSKNPKCSNGFKKTNLINLKPKESGPCFELGKLSGNLTCVASGGEKIWFKLTLEQSKDGYPVIGSKCFRNDVVAMGYNSSNEYVPIVCSFRESGHFPKWLDI